MGLNLLGTEALLWNRSTLVRLLHFPLRSAGRPKLPAFVSPTPADVRKRVNVSLRDAWEFGASLRRDRRPQTRVENKLHPGCGHGRNRSDALRRLNLYFFSAHHLFSSSFVAFWRHPKLSLGVNLWGFSNADVSMFILSMFGALVSNVLTSWYLRGSQLMAINERKRTNYRPGSSPGL